MDTKMNGWLLALAHTTDVDEAMKLTEKIGPQLPGAKCSLFFPKEWVLKQCEGPVGIAVWYVQHCNDSATLDKLAETPNIRIKVRDALAFNKYLSSSARAKLTGQAEEVTKVPHKVPLTTKADRLLGRKGNNWVRNLAEVLELLAELIEEGHSEYVDRFIDEYAKRDCNLMVQSLFTRRYLPGFFRVEDRGSVFDYSTYTPEEALAKLDPQVQNWALVGYARNLFASNVAPLKKITKDQARSILRAGVGSVAAQFGHTEWLDEVAIEVAIGDARWAGVLNLSLLSDEQLARLLTTVAAAGNPSAMFGLVKDERDYAAAKAILDHPLCKDIRPGVPFGNLIRFGQAVWASGDQDLCDRYLEKCDTSQIFNLIVGAGSSRPRMLLPEAMLSSTIDLLVERVKAPGPDSSGARLVDVCVLAMRYMYGSLEDNITFELVLKVPGLAASIPPGSRPFDGEVGKFIYGTLQRTGIDTDMAFEMLYTQRESSLAQVAETCAAFARGA